MNQTFTTSMMSEKYNDDLSDRNNGDVNASKVESVLPYLELNNETNFQNNLQNISCGQIEAYRFSIDSINVKEICKNKAWGVYGKLSDGEEIGKTYEVEEFCVVDQGPFDDNSLCNQYGEQIKDRNGKVSFGSEKNSCGVYRILPPKVYQQVEALEYDRGDAIGVCANIDL
jgi:hypothetical protein